MVRILNKYVKQTAAGELGFTLVEQVVSLAILALVLTAGMAALATGGLSLNVAASKNEAMSLAQAHMECIKNHQQYNTSGAGYPLSAPLTETECGIQPTGYKVDATVSGSGTVQTIVVTVSRGAVGNWSTVLVLEDLKVNRP